MTMTDIAAAAVRIMTMKIMIMRSMSIIITTIMTMRCGCEDHDHEHHHDHDDECSCGCHDHEHHHHHADEVFSSWGLETIDAVNKDQLTAILEELAYGKSTEIFFVQRACFRVRKRASGTTSIWFRSSTRSATGAPDYTGKVCVIGANLKEDELKKAFGRNE